MQITLQEKAARYVQKLPPAVSGQGGHNQTFRAACVLTQGFGLSIAEARPIMHDYNSRCQPPWTEEQIEHKLANAYNTPDPKGKGYMLTQRGVIHRYEGRESPPTTAAYTPPPPAPLAPGAKPKQYGLNGEVIIPSPILNGAMELLVSAFQPGEGVRICIARTNDEGKEVPKDSGVTLSREEWIHKLEKNGGDPNKIMSSSAKNGIFISVNPLKLGGSRDADVTAFRHVLLEFDHISNQEQWNLIVQSGIPVTAVISSGGKSIHAWVRVDAKDRKEYDERCKVLYSHFKDYKPDEKNKNPSRFSRLPNCVRGKSRQELLALKMGSESFLEWQINQDADDLGEEIQVADLLEFVPSEDPNTVLGKRWLCRGGSCLWVGQSGIGKSSLAMQAAILWALGRSFFGISAKKPLKSLFIQAENDLGDLAEMFQGVWLGMNLPGPEAPEVARAAQSNIVVRKLTTHTGKAFTEILRRLIDKYKPDLVWIDPLLSYIGDDIAKQSVCSQFLRNWINPISEATGVIWMMLHHTGKPSADAKSRSNWNSTDYSYIGTGSSELTNWARAVNVLKRVDEDTFELNLAKRGGRAGARDYLNNPVNKLFLKHSEHGICWVQTSAPEPKKKTNYTVSGGSGRPSKDFDFDGFLASIKGEHFNATQLADRAAAFGDLSKRSVYVKILQPLKDKMAFDPEFKTYSVSLV